MLTSSLFVACSFIAPVATAHASGGWCGWGKCDFGGLGGQGGHKCKDIKVEDLEFRDLGTRLRATGELKCLDGNRDVEITLRAEGELEVSCENPGGNKPKPHQKQSRVKVEGEETIPAEDIEKRSADFTVKTDAIGPKHKCPNANWKQEADISFERATLVIEQGREKVVIQCTFDGGTSDGRITDFDCEEKKH
ncbi:hypothetical protein [Nannocystis pusilla]|uniref:Uncharacterized protein n=1 Tax=Nannocystis pusilla TaxID=889268 RepID=A0ABS7U1Z4_9BACT|nr:hypothetical protein [Nannocystis pusilla]MBZ5714548.1 hypothetical protein [Nannocystis pusilla]